MYVCAHHYSYMVTLENQMSYKNIEAGYFSAKCLCSLEEHTKNLEINLKDLLCPFIFVDKWWKFTGVIQSACVLHLNDTTLYQVESTAISDSECHPSQSFCLDFNLYSFGFLFRANCLVNLVLCTFRMTEFKALSLISHCRPLLRFSLWTICNIYYAWSPLRGLRQMLSNEISTDHVQEIK